MFHYYCRQYQDEIEAAQDLDGELEDIHEAVGDDEVDGDLEEEEELPDLEPVAGGSGDNQRGTYIRYSTYNCGSWTYI
jgi:hypothetical protein